MSASRWHWPAPEHASQRRHRNRLSARFLRDVCEPNDRTTHPFCFPIAIINPNDRRFLMKLFRSSAEGSPLREKFATARKELTAALIERDEEVDLALTALLAGEHLLLVGPPGCGKSLLLDSLLTWTGGQKFSILFTKFTTPEECVGPVSLSALKTDKYIRVTSGKLPEAEFAFLDEIFKASSAILNTLLKLLNERTFDAGDGVTRAVPLRLCVAASNEWPSPDTGKELAALFDRFVLRRSVSPIRSRVGRQKLLWNTDHIPKLSGTITPAEIDEARRTSSVLSWSGEAKEALESILHELAKEGVRPGDRRQFKTVGVVRAFAYLNGAERVEPEHLEVAQYCLWDDPIEQPQTVTQVIARIANPTGMRVTQLLLEVESVLAATDARNLAEAAKAAAKLGEIDRQLAALSGNGRIEKARTYLKEQLKKLKLASIEAV
jgi:MoxR-like ATPase